MKTKKEKPETIFRVRKTQIKQQVCQKGDRLGECPADWPCSVAILFSHCKYKLFAENRSPLNSPAGQLLKKILGKTPEIRIESGVTEGKSLLAIPLFFCSPFFFGPITLCICSVAVFTPAILPPLPWGSHAP